MTLKNPAWLVLCVAATGCLNTDPVTISIPTGTLTFATVVTSLSHSCALTPAGAAYCWGANAAGKLGDGTIVDRSEPTAVAGGLTFISIAPGHSTTCGLVADGSAYCWGLNDAGQFGDGTKTSRLTPTPAAVGHHFSVIVFSDIATLPPYEVCGLETTGATFCWGRGNTAPIGVATGLSFTNLSAGTSGAFCGIVAGGDAYCWGFNFSGELGTGSRSISFATTPTLVTGDHAFASISIGYGFTCGITTDSHLYCWGDDADAQYGDGGMNQTSLIPKLVQADRTYAGVSAGFDGTCGVNESGTGYCWGYSRFGILGIGPVSDGVVSIPVPVAGNLTFASISNGLYNTCGVTTSHIAYCWGQGGIGLGIGADGSHLSAVYTPLKVALQVPLTK